METTIGNTELFLYVLILIITTAILIITVMSSNKLKRLIYQLRNALSENTGRIMEPPTPADSPETKDQSSEQNLSKRELVLQAIKSRRSEIDVPDLPRVEEELVKAFDAFMGEDYFQKLDSKAYYRTLDLTSTPGARVAVVGDIHCDNVSLEHLLLKIAVSKYDYFGEGYIVFLGDYLDRGLNVFEPLLLLLDVKRIMGDRCILLRGNHEMISYDESTKELLSLVKPQQTCPTLNRYCNNNREFLRKFGQFFSTLPTYLWLKTQAGNQLLVHASFPKDEFIDLFRFDENTGELVFEPSFVNEKECACRAAYEKMVEPIVNVSCKEACIETMVTSETLSAETDASISEEESKMVPGDSVVEKNNETNDSTPTQSLNAVDINEPEMATHPWSIDLDNVLLSYRNKILKDMIWGDPKECPFKMQSNGRFEFGKEQFQAYATKNSVIRLFRSHEPVAFGVKSFFDRQLYTIFSTGGETNKITGYDEVKSPAFAVIDASGACSFECIYLYKVTIGNVLCFVGDTLTDTALEGKDVKGHYLSEEFYCSSSMFDKLFD